MKGPLCTYTATYVCYNQNLTSKNCPEPAVSGIVLCGRHLHFSPVRNFQEYTMYVQNCFPYSQSLHTYYSIQGEDAYT